MDLLRAYLKTLKPAERAAYAIRAGTTLGYLQKAIYAKPEMDGALCRRLDEESGGAVPRVSLRPDIWPAHCPHCHTTNQKGGTNVSRDQ